MDAKNERQKKRKPPVKKEDSQAKNLTPNQGYADSCPSWVLNMSKGAIRQNKSSRNFGFNYAGTPYCPITAPGNVVGIHLDNKEHTLSFSINYRDCGVAFRDVQGDLYPILTFFGEAASGTLIKTVRIAISIPWMDVS